MKNLSVQSWHFVPPTHTLFYLLWCFTAFVYLGIAVLQEDHRKITESAPAQQATIHSSWLSSWKHILLWKQIWDLWLTVMHVVFSWYQVCCGNNTLLTLRVWEQMCHSPFHPQLKDTYAGNLLEMSYCYFPSIIVLLSFWLSHMWSSAGRRRGVSDESLSCDSKMLKSFRQAGATKVMQVVTWESGLKKCPDISNKIS